MQPTRQFGSFRRRAHPIIELAQTAAPVGPQPPPVPTSIQDISWTTPSTRSANASLIVDAGDFDAQDWFRSTVSFETASAATTYLFTSSTPEGELSLRIDPGHVIRLKVRGVDVTFAANFPTSTLNQFRAGDDVVWRAWYRPSVGTYGLRVTVNGVVLPDLTGATTGGALAAPTSATIGTTIADTSIAQRFVAVAKSAVPVATTPEIVVIGDSTVAPWPSTYGGLDGSGAFLISCAHDLYTVAERSARPSIGMLAVPGDTTSGQKAKWLASPWSSQSTVKAVIVQVGINDRASGEATVAAAVQDLIATIRTDLPSTKILASELVPFALVDSYASAPFLLAFNADTMGTGSHPLTGVDARVSAHYATLDDGSGGYKVAYNFDNLHENNPGRAIVAAAYRGSLVTLGLLP